MTAPPASDVRGLRMRAVILLTLVVSILPFAPTATADYECTPLPLSAVCAGVDPAPDCFGENSYADWGFDVYAPRGYTAAVGGKKWCSQDANGTIEGKSMDVGVYMPNGQRVSAYSEERATTPTGGERSETCTTYVDARLGVPDEGRSFDCLFEPVHPGDVLLP